MARYAFERLSAQDNSFLVFERPNAPLHVTGVSIYRAGPLRTASGGIDIEAYKRSTASILHRIPRYRQKLKWIPVERHPVWVDDPHFNLDYHVRHTALPRPGTLEELKKKMGRIMVQPLDLSKPLWENWLVEGLEGDRFAVISKMHHCMIDGASGIDLSQILMSPDPSHVIAEGPPYVPRPEPSSWELLKEEWIRRLSLPSRAMASLRELRAEAEDFREEVRTRVRALRRLVGLAASRIPDTPLNGEIGPHRRFEWLDMSLDDLKAIRRALGCTINDVVLAISAGAVRRFFLHRHTNPEDVEFRVSAPVSVRSAEDVGRMGNRVSTWILPLPIGEPDALKQLEAIRELTHQLKESRDALGAEMIMAVAEWTPSVLLSLGARAVAQPMPINLMVTNVPGPQTPLYLLGCEMLATYGAVPLMEFTGLGIALVSYNGRMCWGFNADRDLVPDLAHFVAGLRAAVEELAEVAGVELQGLPEEPTQTQPHRDSPPSPVGTIAGVSGRA